MLICFFLFLLGETSTFVYVLYVILYVAQEVNSSRHIPARKIEFEPSHKTVVLFHHPTFNDHT